jgi:hypothetical protein
VTRTRRIVLMILLIFAIYAIIVSPRQSADVVSMAFDQLAAAVQAIFRFFDALLRR